MSEPAQGGRYVPTHAVFSPDKRLARLWLTPQETPQPYLVFDALAENNKSFLIGFATGQFGQQDNVHLTPLGRKVLARLCEHSDPDCDAIAILELPDRARVEPRLRIAFQTLKSGTAILLLCHGDAIYDALLPHLVIEPPALRPSWLGQQL